MKKVKKFKFKKIAALAIVVSVSSQGSPAYAINSLNNKLQNTNTTNSQHYKKSLSNSNIDKLSTTGKVSNSENVFISSLFATYKSSISKAIKDDFSSKLESLVDLGTITQFQKNVIMNLYTVSKTKNEELIGIHSLVNCGTLTKNQETTILNSFMNSKTSTSKTINDILMLKLDKLISNGTINDDQRSAVINLAESSTVDSK